MKARISILLLCLGTLGCSSESETVSAPRDSGPGELSVTLAVTGDPSASIPDYPILVDFEEAGRIKPGETVNLELDSGYHVVGVSEMGVGFFGVRLKLLSWCEPTTAETYRVRPTPQHSTRVTFGLHCPPLEGAGKMDLQFAAPDKWSDSEISIRLHRLNGSPQQFSLTGVAGRVNSFEVPSGLYGLDASNSNCLLSDMYWLSEESRVIVKANTTLVYNFPMECPDLPGFSQSASHEMTRW